MQTKAFKVAQFKALDEEQGIFEAIVAVFNNVDRAGDRIMPGAFAQSLQDWQAKGRPIPVIFSHEWDNLDAHIGQVLEGKEVEAGLYIQAQLEMDEPFARRVYKKMQAGTLAEFSFAYDVIKSREIDEGEGARPRYITELEQLDIFEVGPCLVGMNPETQLLGVKGLGQGRVQALHDLLVELGAKCAECGGEGEDGPEGEGGDAKSSEAGSSTYAARVAMELLELGAD